MASTNPQPSPRSAPPAGSILLLTDGTICTMLKRGREAPPLTVIVQRRGEAEREIPLEEISDVMWSPAP